MKHLTCIVIAGILVTVLALPAGAVDNPNVRSPVGAATVPPSSIRSGLHRSPNPIDRTSNLVVTGNVGGGKHFRGVLPYNAVRDFGGTLGSTSLDSFLRYSAGSTDSRYYRGEIIPYYSQTGTVTTSQPGGMGVIRPPTTRYDYRIGAESNIGIIPERRVLRDTETAYVEAAWRNVRSRPLSLTPEELDRLILRETEKYWQRKELATEQRTEYDIMRPEAVSGVKEQGDEPLRNDLKDSEPIDRGAALKRELVKLHAPFEPSKKPEPSDEEQKLFELLKPQDKADEEKPLDVYEQMKQQLDELEKSFEPMPIEDILKQQADEEAKEVESAKDKEARKDKSDEDALTTTKAKTVLRGYKSFATFADDKFNQHLTMGEAYLKEGKYYRAADAYTLASIFKPEDPLAYAGKSYALLAAGEYMSSALYLSQAIEIFPEYARLKIDLVEMIGDKDKVENRAVDIAQWAEKTGAGELEFLLSYIYYRLGQLERAKPIIESAYNKMPQAPAVITLREAIGAAVKTSTR